MAPKIPFIKPKFPEPEELIDYIKRIYKNNYYSNNGPMYVEFKAAIEEYLGNGTKAVVVANATLGLMLAIHANIKRTSPEKKYIAIPSFTFAAGPLAIRWCGFEPLFFDINEHSQPSLPSFKAVLDKYADQLAGVFLINDFGIGNQEIGQWEQLLSEKNLPFIIDSAPGFGSTYADGGFVGTRGICEVFSFHATKPFGIGEGGLIVTQDPDLAEELESLKNFGFNDQKQTTGLGINAKITELDCAIGLCLLKKYPDMLVDRRKSYQRFRANLESGQVSFLAGAETSAIQFVSIMVDEQKRPKLLELLKEGGVEARTYYAPAVHTFPFFADCPKTDLSITESMSRRIISLPLHPNMPAETIDYICTIVTKGVEV